VRRHTCENIIFNNLIIRQMSQMSHTRTNLKKSHDDPLTKGAAPSLSIATQKGLSISL
jgi:hypothetical protein